MDYEADWSSKVLLLLLGKKRLMTLLDTRELMFKQQFKDTAAYSFISKQIVYSAIAANTVVVVSSILLSRTVFAKSAFFSPAKLVTDCCLILGSYYSALLYLSEKIKKQVQISKLPYLKLFDQDFLFHFNLLAAKYDIDEKTQVQNIFTDKELELWMNEFYQRPTSVSMPL